MSEKGLKIPLDNFIPVSSAELVRAADQSFASVEVLRSLSPQKATVKFWTFTIHSTVNTLTILTCMLYERLHNIMYSLFVHKNIKFIHYLTLYLCKMILVYILCLIDSRYTNVFTCWHHIFFYCTLTFVICAILLFIVASPKRRQFQSGGRTYWSLCFRGQNAFAVVTVFWLLFVVDTAMAVLHCEAFSEKNHFSFSK